MIKLEFGNAQHIKYVAAKGLQKLKVWLYHGCDCEHCTSPENTCPHCGYHSIPLLLDKYHVGVVKCEDCKKLCFESSSMKAKNYDIIQEVEKNK
jgi:hypothetical protein